VCTVALGRALLAAAPEAPPPGTDEATQRAAFHAISAS
jgi:hypothetical protein